MALENSGTAANGQWWQCQGHQPLAVVVPAVVSLAGYPCDATLTMVPPAWLPLVAVYLPSLILWSLCWFCELPQILLINPCSACVSQGWFLEPRTLTHNLFIHSLNEVFINCLLCLEFSCPSGLAFGSGQTLLFDTINGHSSSFHKYLLAPRPCKALC